MEEVMIQPGCQCTFYKNANEMLNPRISFNQVVASEKWFWVLPSTTKSSCRLKRFCSWCTTDVRNETIQTNHGDKLSTNLLGKPKIHQSAKVVHFRISHGVSSEGSTFFLRLLSIFKKLHPEGGSPHYNGPQHPLTHTGLMHPRHPRHIAVPVTKA